MGHSYAKGIVGTAEFTLQKQVKSLYTDHHGWLHGWLRYRLNDATNAADLAHNTFVRVIARPRSFNTGPEARARLDTRAERSAESVTQGAASLLQALYETDAMLLRQSSRAARAFSPGRGLQHGTPGSRTRMVCVFSHGSILI